MALLSMKAEDYGTAKDALDQIFAIDPENESAKEYMKEFKAEPEEEVKAEERKEKRKRKNGRKEKRRKRKRKRYRMLRSQNFPIRLAAAFHRKAERQRVRCFIWSQESSLESSLQPF